MAQLAAKKVSSPTKLSGEVLGSSWHIIYCDGACSGNPGPGGWAFIWGSPEGFVCEGVGSENQTTNNRMELRGAIEALKNIIASESKFNQVLLHSDSVYVIRGVTQWIFGWQKRGWKTAQGDDVLNKDLWQQLAQLVHRSGLKVEFRYVRGHTGIDGNERCDELAVKASKNERVAPYQGPKLGYHFVIDELPIEEALPESKFQAGSAVKEKVNYISAINGKIFRDSSWAQCEARVKGRPNVKFKKVKSPSEERVLLETWGFGADQKIEGDGEWK